MLTPAGHTHCRRHPAAASACPTPPHCQTARCIIVGTNTTYLSNTINDRFGRNFHTLINDYRIDHAVKLLKSGECPARIKDFHITCGYNSKSVFYESFTRRMGLSPMRYVKALQEDAAPPHTENSL